MGPKEIGWWIVYGKFNAMSAFSVTLHLLTMEIGY